MKRLILLFLLLSGLGYSQTLIKLKQLEKSTGAGSVIVTDGTGTPTYSTIAGLGGWELTGNTVGNNTSFLGSLDNFDIGFRTNNTARWLLDKNGILTSYSTASTGTTSGMSWYGAGGFNYIGNSIWNGTGTFTGNIVTNGTSSVTGTSSLNGITNVGNITSTGTGSFGTTLTAGNSTFSNMIATGTGSIGSTFSVTGASVLTGGVTTPTVYGSSASAGNLYVNSTSSGTNGSIFLGYTTGVNGGYVKEDSLSVFTIKTNTLLGNVFNFQSFTGQASPKIPAIYMGQTIPSNTNYMILSDTIDMVYNSPRKFKMRRVGTNFFEANPTPTTGTVYFNRWIPITLGGLTASTAFYNNWFSGNVLGYATGSISLLASNYFENTTYTAAGASTITNVYTVYSISNTIGSNFSATNNWAIGANGNFGAIKARIGSVTTAPTATLDVTGTASVSSTTTLNGLTNLGGITTSTSFSAGTTGIFTGNVTLPHVIGGSSAPTIASGTGLGTGAGTVVSVTRATDLSGIIGVVTGTASLGTAATLATITYNVAYGAAPTVMLTPANQAAADLIIGTNIFVGSTNTASFALTTNTVGLSASSTYSFYYAVFQ